MLDLAQREMLRQRVMDNKVDVFAIGLLVVLSAAIFGWVIRWTISGFDYGFHVQWAQTMAETRSIPFPHFLYHLLVVIGRLLIPVDNIAVSGRPISSYFISAFAVTTMLYVALSLVVYGMLRAAFTGGVSAAAALAVVAAAIGLMIASPITLFTFQIRNLYYGYIVPSVYHNPTIVLLKPLALLLFGVVSAQIISTESKKGAAALSAALMVLSTLAKPSFSICLLPALGLWIACRSLKKQSVNWQFVLLAVALPAVAVLGWQYYFQFVSQSTAQIALEPLKVMIAHTLAEGLSPLTLLPKFALSILFPVCVYTFYFRDASRSPRLNLAWLVFGVGAAFTYLLSDAGQGRTLAGDFLWSGQVTLFVLFVESALFMARQANVGFAALQRVDWRASVCAAVFALHVVSGVIWYASAMLGDRALEWW